MEQRATQATNRDKRKYEERMCVSARIAEKKLRQKIKVALSKSSSDLTSHEVDILSQNTVLATEVLEQKMKYAESQQRQAVRHDAADVILAHAQRLLFTLIATQHTVVYTGAGISTAANIPDYRGPSGLWTRAQKGESLQTIRETLPDLAKCQPTYAHMVLSHLVDMGVISFVVSQNCDGLHLRSGIPRLKLAELHGNCFVEWCPLCSKVFYRRFDVTSKSRLRKHETGRLCTLCQSPLEDTIVFFSEATRCEYVANWKEAMFHANKMTCVVILGSSLKVLKAYPCLWKRVRQRKCELFIINLQWTPFDRYATQKTHCDIDEFMRVLVRLHDNTYLQGSSSTNVLQTISSDSDADDCYKKVQKVNTNQKAQKACVKSEVTQSLDAHKIHQRFKCNESGQCHQTTTLVGDDFDSKTPFQVLRDNVSMKKQDVYTENPIQKQVRALEEKGRHVGQRLNQALYQTESSRISWQPRTYNECFDPFWISCDSDIIAATAADGKSSQNNETAKITGPAGWLIAGLAVKKSL